MQPTFPAAHLLHYQTNLQSHASRLATTVEGMASTTHERDQELAQLSQMLRELKQQKSGKKCNRQAETQQQMEEPVSSTELGATKQGVAKPAHTARGDGQQGEAIVGKGLGALESANNMFSQFQRELEDELSLLALHADTARVTASAVRAQLGALHQTRSPLREDDVIKASKLQAAFDAAANKGEDTPAPPTRNVQDKQPELTPSGESASLWQLLQDAAHQRALAESALLAGTAGQFNGSPLWRHLMPVSPKTTSGKPPEASANQTSTDGDAKLDKPMSGPEQRTGGAESLRRASNDTAQVDQAGTTNDAGSPKPSVYNDGGAVQADIAMLLAQRSDVQADLTRMRAEYVETQHRLSCAKQEASDLNFELVQLRQQVQEAQDSLARLQKQRECKAQKCGEEASYRAQLQQEIAQHEAHLAACKEAVHQLQALPLQAQSQQQQLQQEMMPAKSRARKRAKRQAVRRSMSCGDLAAAAAQAPPTSAKERDEASSSSACSSLRASLMSPQQLPHKRCGVHVQAQDAVQMVASHPGQHVSVQTDMLQGCISCSCIKDQLSAAQRQALSLQQQLGQQQLKLEQERRAFVGKETELALTKQRLRGVLAEGSKVDSRSQGSTWGSGGGTSSRPLSMAGWEDLIDEASADLEQLEGHVCTATQRLIEIQAQSTQLQGQVAEAAEEKLRAEQALQAAQLQLKEAQTVRERLEASCKQTRQQAVELDAAADTARLALAELERQLGSEKQVLADHHASLEQVLAELQAAEKKALQIKHEQEATEEEFKNVQHQLQLARNELEATTKAAAQAAQERTSAQAAAAAYQQDKEGLREQQEELMAQIAKLTQMKHDAEAAAGEAGGKAQRVRKELESLVQDVETAEAKLGHAEDALQRAQHEQQRIAASMSEQRQLLEDLNAQKQSAEAEFQKVQKQLQGTVEEAEQCRTEVATAASKQQHADEQLARLTAQITSAQQQLSDLQLQAATAHRQVLSGSAAGILQTPANELGLGFHYTTGSALSPMSKDSGAKRSLNFQRNTNLTTALQLQAEMERLQLALSQAESRKRVAEQRAQDAEQAAEELQARVSALQRAQRQAAAAAADTQPDNTSAARLKFKVEELEAEVESANRLASRFKSRLAVAQDEVSGLEDSLQRERQQVARLRQQLTEAQAQAQPSRLLSIQATPSYWAGVPESDMEAGHAQLRKLQQQISRNQALNTELLEEQRTLRQQCSALREQLDETASEQQAARQQITAARKALQQLEQEKQEVEAEVVELREARGSEQRRVAETRRTYTQLGDAVAELQQLQGEVNAQVLYLQQEAQQLKEQRASLLQAAAAAESVEVGRLQEEVDALQQHLRATHTQLEDARGKHEEAMAACEAAHTVQQKEAEDLLNALRRHNEQLVAELEANGQRQALIGPVAKALLVSVETQTGRTSALDDDILAEVKLDAADRELDTIQTQLQAAAAQLASVTAELAEARQHLSDTQAAVAAAAAEEEALREVVDGLVSDKEAVEEALEHIRQQLEASYKLMQQESELEEEACVVIEEEEDAGLLGCATPDASRAHNSPPATATGELLKCAQQLQADLSTVQAELQEAHSALAEAEHQGQLAAARARSCEAERDAHRDQAAELSVKLSKAEEARRAAELRAAEQQEGVALATARASQLDQTVQRQEAAIFDLEQQLKESRAAQAGLASTLVEAEELRRQVAKLTASLSELESLRSELAASQTAVSQARAAAAAAEGVAAAARGEAAELQAQVATLQASRAEMQDASAAGQAAAAATGVQMAAEAEAKVVALEEQLLQVQHALEGQQEEAQSQVQALQSELDAARESSDEQAQECARLKTLLEEAEGRAQEAVQQLEVLVAEAQDQAGALRSMEDECSTEAALRQEREQELERMAAELANTQAALTQAQTEVEKALMKPACVSEGSQAGGAPTMRSAGCQAPAETSLRFAACQTDQKDKVSTEDAATATELVTTSHAVCQTQHCDQWPDLDALRTAAMQARHAQQVAAAEVAAAEEQVSCLAKKIVEQEADLAQLEAQAAAAEESKIQRARQAESDIAHMQQQLQQLKAQEASLQEKCEGLQDQCAGVRAEVRKEMRAVQSAVKSAGLQWCTSKKEMEQECEALHDMRVSLLADAMEARQELQRAVAALRPAHHAHRVQGALQAALAQLRPSNPDRATISTAVQCVAELYEAAAKLMPNTLTTSTSNAGGLLAPGGPGAGMLLPGTQNAATVCATCPALAQDLAALRARAESDGALLAALQDAAKRTFLYTHAKAKALRKALVVAGPTQAPVRTHAAGTSDAAPAPAAADDSVGPAAVGSGASAAEQFKHMWGPIEEQLGKLLKVCTHAVQQHRQVGSAPAPAMPAPAAPESTRRQHPPTSASTSAHHPSTPGMGVAALDARLSQVSKLATKLDQDMQASACKLAGSAHSPCFVRVQPLPTAASGPGSAWKPGAHYSVSARHRSSASEGGCEMPGVAAAMQQHPWLGRRATTGAIPAPSLALAPAPAPARPLNPVLPPAPAPPAPAYPQHPPPAVNVIHVPTSLTPTNAHTAQAPQSLAQQEARPPITGAAGGTGPPQGGYSADPGPSLPSLQAALAAVTAAAAQAPDTGHRVRRGAAGRSSHDSWVPQVRVSNPSGSSNAANAAPASAAPHGLFSEGGDAQQRPLAGGAPLASSSTSQGVGWAGTTGLLARVEEMRSSLAGGGRGGLHLSWQQQQQLPGQGSPARSEGSGSSELWDGSLLGVASVNGSTCCTPERQG